MDQKKPSKPFDDNYLRGGIKKRSLRGGAMNVSSQVFTFILRLAAMMVLARILSPNDYGIIGMAVAITSFAHVFSELGLSTATIQQSKITHEQVSTLFWINSGMGMLLTIFVAISSPLVAKFFNTPEVTPVIITMSTVFFLKGLAIQHRALLVRQMRFSSLSIISISSIFIGCVVAIVFARFGYGYWALVFLELTTSILSLIGICLVAGWAPGLPRYNVGAGSMMKFGLDIFGFNVINYFSRNLDNVLIGRIAGSFTLGLYNTAYQLLMVPITNLRIPLNQVAMPSLSRLQNEPLKYRNYYIKYTSILAFVSMPVVAFMFVCSDQLINLVLGHKWAGASILFKILSFAALIQPVASSRGLVMISTGETRRYFYWGIANASLTCLSFILGIPWGVKGIAISYVISNYIILYPSLHYAFYNTPIKPKDFFQSIYKALVSSLIMGVGGGLFDSVYWKL